MLVSTVSDNNHMIVSSVLVIIIIIFQSITSTIIDSCLPFLLINGSTLQELASVNMKKL